MNILVTGIGGPIAQGIIEGLRQNDEIFIVGADRRSLTSGHIFCDKTYEIPSVSEEKEYKKAILEIIDRENIQAIFPALPQEMVLHGWFVEELPIPAALPRAANYDRLTNKEEIYEYLKEVGLGTFVPRYYGFSNGEELAGIAEEHFKDSQYIAVKEVSSYGALGFALLTDHQGFIKALAENRTNVLALEDYCELPLTGRHMAMDYLEGTEYSVDVYVYRGRTLIAVPRERTGVSSGIVLEGVVVEDHRLMEAAARISESLITSGFINLQFFDSAQGFQLTDVNPRFGGSQVMSLGAGVNFPLLFIEDKVLRKTPEMPHPKWNTRMFRHRGTSFHRNGEWSG